MTWQQGGEGGSRGEEEEGPLYRHKDPLPCSPHTSPSSHLAHHLCGGSEGRVQAGARAADAPAGPQLPLPPPPPSPTLTLLTPWAVGRRAGFRAPHTKSMSHTLTSPVIISYSITP